MRSLLAILLLVPACEVAPGDSTSSSSSSSSSSGATTPAGSSLVPIDTSVLCPKLVDTCRQPLTLPGCKKQYGSLRVTATCAAALKTATCEALGSASSSVSSTCFPRCTGTLAACNADGTITLCTDNGSSQVADCSASCIAEGYTLWTGTCGTSFETQTSERAQCWCR